MFLISMPSKSGATCTAVILTQCLNGCRIESKLYMYSGVQKYENIKGGMNHD